ncbi:type II toxin-antitoxin system VapC family toxin [Candidatus Pacearchaeota archaeon]|nr:type II toxin-antitoxin system VapC family toxin [Candidatus Pacearchaeota archaeon]
MIYLDANIFVYSVLDTGEKGRLSKELLEKIALKKIAGVTSTLTWDEIVFSLKKYASFEEVFKQSKQFRTFPNLIFLDATQRVIEKAEELWQIYSLDPRDAIHAATAIINGVREIASSDSDFDRVKELKRLKI